MGRNRHWHKEQGAVEKVHASRSRDVKIKVRMGSETRCWTRTARELGGNRHGSCSYSNKPFNPLSHWKGESGKVTRNGGKRGGWAPKIFSNTHYKLVRIFFRPAVGKERQSNIEQSQRHQDLGGSEDKGDSSVYCET